MNKAPAKPDKKISIVVEEAFSDIDQDRNSVIQLYIGIAVNKIEQHESSMVKATAAALIGIVVFTMITNQYLSDIEIGGVKIEKLNILIPFFPLYIGYLFYSINTSFACVILLDQIAKDCFSLLAPKMKYNPLNSIFMSKPFLGAENQDFTHSYKIEKLFNRVIMTIILVFLFIFSLASMTYICYVSISSSVLPKIWSIVLSVVGAGLTIRSYVYCIANLHRLGSG